MSPVVDDRRVVIYQIYFDERSRRRLDPLWTPWQNCTVTPFFESAVIAQLLAEGHHRDADYFGVLSWKFRRKIPLSAAEILRRIASDGFSSDVYSFFGRLKPGRIWALAEQKHPGILRTASTLMHRLGIAGDAATLEAPLVYQNHFICRADLYERFGGELLTPALALMRDTADTELQALLHVHARYVDPAVPVPRLLQMFRRPYFCLHPFVAERLFSTWLALNPSIRVRHIWRGRFVEPDQISNEAEMTRAGEVRP